MISWNMEISGGTIARYVRAQSKYRPLAVTADAAPTGRQQVPCPAVTSGQSNDSSGAAPEHRTRAMAGAFLERHRTIIQGTLDCLTWVVALPVALVLRYDVTLQQDSWGPFSLSGLALAVVVACFLQITTGLALGLYRGHWRFGSFDEVAHLVRTSVVVAVLLGVFNAVASERLLPVSVVFAGALTALVLMAGVRYVWRLVLERWNRPSVESSTPVLIFGAGDAGAQLVGSMLRDPSSPFLPVGLIDDNPAKRKLSIMGVRVLGGRHSVAAAAQEQGASTLVIAIPAAAPEVIRELSEIALEADLDLKILPPLRELLDGSVDVGDVRSVSTADLLGRREIDTDIDAVAGYLTGRRVLITGAGGSIGSELCRQVSRFAPASLVMLDRDESALHGVQLDLDGRALLDVRTLVVADIRDRDRIDEVFAEHQPEVLFHAAALKHLPLLEMHPGEAYKTNVLGTQILLEAARAGGVDRFVNISTDKAADPISALGASKRIAERLTAEASRITDRPFMSVRFGNVLGSRGSVLTTFTSQVDRGGPVTVTDPDVTRYFMTVEEAVQLVVQAGAFGDGGEVLVLDMGEPVRVDDIARRLAAQAPRPVEVVYTGLRPGEKLDEVLIGVDEVTLPSAHPLVARVEVPPIAATAIDVSLRGLDDQAVAALLAELSASPATSSIANP